MLVSSPALLKRRRSYKAERCLWRLILSVSWTRHRRPGHRNPHSFWLGLRACFQKGLEFNQQTEQSRGASPDVNGTDGPRAID